jgi:hypothetical protein
MRKTIVAIATVTLGSALLLSGASAKTHKHTQKPAATQTAALPSVPGANPMSNATVDKIPPWAPQGGSSAPGGTKAATVQGVVGPNPMSNATVDKIPPWAPQGGSPAPGGTKGTQTVQGIAGANPMSNATVDKIPPWAPNGRQH